MFTEVLDEIDNLILDKNYERALEVLAQVLDKNQEKDSALFEGFFKRLETITKKVFISAPLLNQLEDIRGKLASLDYMNNDTFIELYAEYVETIKRIRPQQPQQIRFITGKKRNIRAVDNLGPGNADQYGGPLDDFSDDPADKYQFYIDAIAEFSRSKSSENMSLLIIALLENFTKSVNGLFVKLIPYIDECNRANCEELNKDITAKDKIKLIARIEQLALLSAENTTKEADALVQLINCRELLKNKYVNHTFAYVYLNNIYKKFPDQILLIFVDNPELLFHPSLLLADPQQQLFSGFGIFLVESYPDPETTEKIFKAAAHQKVNPESASKIPILNGWESNDPANKKNKRSGLFGNTHTELKKLLTTTLKKYDFSLGVAMDTGDCFFDALAQAYNARSPKIQHTAKTLRELCYEYIISSTEDNAWVKDALKYNDADYQHYQIRLPFTADEMESHNQARTLTGIATWGNPSIEGRILSKKLGINLLVIEARSAQGELRDMLTHQLVTPERCMDIDSDDVAQHFNNADTISLAVGKNHFVPVLSSKQGSLALKH